MPYRSHRLQLTFPDYGASIPLGPGWLWGGSVVPANTAVAVGSDLGNDGSAGDVTDPTSPLAPTPLPVPMADTPQPWRTASLPAPNPTGLGANPALQATAPVTGLVPLATSNTRLVAETALLASGAGSMLGSAGTNSNGLSPFATGVVSLGAGSDGARSRPDNVGGAIADLNPNEKSDMPLIPTIAIPIGVLVLILSGVGIFMWYRQRSNRKITRTLAAKSSGFGGWLLSGFRPKSKASSTNAYASIPPSTPSRKQTRDKDGDVFYSPRLDYRHSNMDRQNIPQMAQMAQMDYRNVGYRPEDFRSPDEKAALLPGYVAQYHRQLSSMDTRNERPEASQHLNPTLLKRISGNLGRLSPTNWGSNGPPSPSPRRPSGNTLERGIVDQDPNLTSLPPRVARRNDLTPQLLFNGVYPQNRALERYDHSPMKEDNPYDGFTSLRSQASNWRSPPKPVISPTKPSRLGQYVVTDYNDSPPAFSPTRGTGVQYNDEKQTWEEGRSPITEEQDVGLMAQRVLSPKKKSKPLKAQHSRRDRNSGTFGGHETLESAINR